jgi:hypothetical protein
VLRCSNGKVTGQFIDWVRFCSVKSKKKMFSDFHFLFYNVNNCTTFDKFCAFIIFSFLVGKNGMLVFFILGGTRLMILVYMLEMCLFLPLRH